MTDKARSRWIEFMYYMIAVAGILVMLIVTYAIKGIAPFGNGTVAEIDVGAGTIPSIYHFWDCLHGKSNFFYEYYTMGGVESYAQSVFDGFLAPINLLVGLFPRSAVLYFVNYALAIRLVLMIVIAYFAFRKLFPNLNKNIILLFSFAWTLSGWTMVHSMVYSFVDVVIVFPLLVLAFKRLMEHEKADWFIVLLTYSLLVNFYISYMLLLGMILCGGTAIIFFVPKERRKRVVAKLTLSILGAFLLSAVAVFPAVIASLRSARITGATVSYNNKFLFSKLFVLTTLAIILLSFGLLVRNYKKDKPTIKFFLIVVGFTIVGLVLERINLMWHTGSYWNYPYRYSFIAIFLLIMGGLYYFDKFYNQEAHEAKPNKWFIVTMCIGLFALVSFTAIECVVFSLINPGFMISYVQWILVLLPTVVAGFLLYKVLKLNSVKLKSILVGVICFVQMFSLSVSMIGVVNNVEEDYRIDNNVFVAQEMYEIDFVPDSIYRYKDKDELLFYRGNDVMHRDSVSGWIHLLTKAGSEAISNLGYNVSGPSGSSAGGTIFSDMLINTRYVLSLDGELDSEVYTLVNSMHSEHINKDIYLYEYNYTLPVGLLLDKSTLDIEIPDYLDAFEYQNFVYRNFFGYTTDIIDTLIPTYTQTSHDKITYTLNNVEGNLYLNVLGKYQRFTKFKVNDKEIEHAGANNIIDLGVYRNETVVVTIEYEDYDLDHHDYEFGQMSLNKLQELETRFEGQATALSFDDNKISASVTAADDQVLYIPYTYSSYITAKDSDRSISSTMGGFLAIEVTEGENNIVLEYHNTLIKPSAIISIVALILIIAIWLIHHFTHILDKKGVYMTVYFLGMIMAVVIVAYVFALPLLKTFLW